MYVYIHVKLHVSSMYYMCGCGCGPHVKKNVCCMWCTVLPSTFIVRHWARRIDTELLAFAKGGFAGWNGKRCVVDWSSFPVRVGGVGNDRPLAQHRSVAVVLAEVRFIIKIKAVSGWERKCTC